jgi:hypothetical protein
VRALRFFLPAAAALLVVAATDAAGRSHRESEDAPDGTIFRADGLQFVLPGRWIAQPAADDVRAGQWRIPAARGAAPGPDDGELVVFYFGPGLGGTAQENIDGWRGTIRDAAGKPVVGAVTTRKSGGFKVTELIAAGAYRDPAPMAGVPPVMRAGYELAGAVIEGPQGNLYWRLTGPEALVTAALPLFRQAIDSVKPLSGG